MARIRSASTASAAARSARAAAVASGQDIYAVTARLGVEAAIRILAGAGDAAGVASVGARFDAKDFLSSLSPQHLVLG